MRCEKLPTPTPLMGLAWTIRQPTTQMSSRPEPLFRATIRSRAAGDATLKDRTWVLLTEAKEGGWGLWGHAHTNAELVAAARDEIAKLRSASS